MDQVMDLWLAATPDVRGRKWGRGEILLTFGSAREAFLSGQIKSPITEDDAQKKAQAMQKKGIHWVNFTEEEYPSLLRDIPDPPWLLYFRGDISCCEDVCVGIVGSRKISPYGKWAAHHLAETAASHGAVVVSGMALGADTAAHEGALAAGGKTVAVFGCGIDLCYPPSNEKLMERILEEGAVISEYPPGTPGFPFNFPVRNRIVSGLSHAVVVAEAGLSSGSLITAELAVTQGREVLAVPGNINQPTSIGTNKLIQDGATPLVTAMDLVEALGLKKKKAPARRIPELSSEERDLVDRLAENGEMTRDQLCRLTGRKPSEINALVTVLEMKGILHSSIGKIFLAN
ncbi:MAG: DNA-protecting protein DprA [Clostridiales bacterium]|nr:DNA-protecting protein DprA [Clostridiales bacterium]